MSAAVQIPLLAVERVTELHEDDLNALCEATNAAILDGGGFGWISPPGQAALERYFRGVMLVPERELFVARADGVITGPALFSFDVMRGGQTPTFVSISDCDSGLVAALRIGVRTSGRIGRRHSDRGLHSPVRTKGL